LKPEVLAVTLGGKSIAEVCALSIDDCAAFLKQVTLNKREAQIAERVMKEVHARLGFLLDVGLDYLSLDRPAATLSGGEAQRIRLATQIGSGLVGVLYVLDEPSIGLHQRDNRRLIDTLTRLRDLGNTLIRRRTRRRDNSNRRLGRRYWSRSWRTWWKSCCLWPYEELIASKESITGAYLSGRKSIEIPSKRRPVDAKRQLVVKGAKENNLKDIEVSIPLGLFVSVTGVSGSGKSTLVNDILYTTLANKLNGARLVPGRHRTVTGIDQLDKVVHVDQSPIGRTPRSNPATYTGVFDKVRALFAETSEAKVRGYQQGRFSFNVKGGRCENCSGDGTITIEYELLA
jgi:excinuclease ABC subunit A